MGQYGQGELQMVRIESFGFYLCWPLTFIAISEILKVHVQILS